MSSCTSTTSKGSKQARPGSGNTARLLSVDGTINLMQGHESTEEEVRSVVDLEAWCSALKSLQASGLQLDKGEMEETFAVIDASGAGVVSLPHFEAALRLAASARLHRRTRIAWLAKEAQKANQRQRWEHEGRDLLAAAEAALAMRDPVLAQRRLILARQRFLSVYAEDAEMFEEVERELVALQGRIHALTPDGYGNSMPTPPRVDTSKEAVRGGLSHSRALPVSLSQSLLRPGAGGEASGKMMGGEEAAGDDSLWCGKESMLAANLSSTSHTSNMVMPENKHKAKGVVYQSKAQLFLPADGSEGCEECSYVSSVTVQATALTGRLRGKETREAPEFMLALLTVSPPTSSTMARASAASNAGSASKAESDKIYDSHALDGQVKAESHARWPFWIWLSWPHRSSTPRHSVVRKRYGLRFATGVLSRACTRTPASHASHVSHAFPASHVPRLPRLPCLPCLPCLVGLGPWFL